MRREGLKTYSFGTPVPFFFEKLSQVFESLRKPPHGFLPGQKEKPLRVFFLCSNSTLCSNFFPKVSGDSDNEFRHGSASAPEHAGKRVPPLLPLRVRPRTHRFPFSFCLRGIYFSEWAIGSRAGFSLKGETDGIQTTVLSTLIFTLT